MAECVNGRKAEHLRRLAYGIVSEQRDGVGQAQLVSIFDNRSTDFLPEKFIHIKSAVAELFFQIGEPKILLVVGIDIVFDKRYDVRSSCV